MLCYAMLCSSSAYCYAVASPPLCSLALLLCSEEARGVVLEGGILLQARFLECFAQSYRWGIANKLLMTPSVLFMKPEMHQYAVINSPPLKQPRTQAPTSVCSGCPARPAGPVCPMPPFAPMIPLPALPCPKYIPSLLEGLTQAEY